MKKELVVGGANGIGLSIATELAVKETCEKIYIVDKAMVEDEYLHSKFETFLFDLKEEDYSFFDRFDDIDAVMITAGFGRLALFKDVSGQNIISSFDVNTLAPIRIIHRFMGRLM